MYEVPTGETHPIFWKVHSMVIPEPREALIMMMNNEKMVEIL